MKRHRNHWLWALLLVTVLTFTSVLNALAAEVVVDTFSYESTETSYQIPSNPTFPVTVYNASGSGVSEVLGGQREVCLTVTAGDSSSWARFRTDETNDYLSLALDPSVKGIGIIQWDGSNNNDCTLDATGLGSVDLTDSSTNTGILLRIVNSDGIDVNITVRLYTDGSNWASKTVAWLSVVTTGNVVDLFLPFSGFTDQAGTMNPASIGAVELELDATLADGADMTIKMVKATNVYEYGDLHPSYGYAAILNARHIPQGMWLGNRLDTEGTHQASIYANGDNNASYDDEDGVTRDAPESWSSDDGGCVLMTVRGCSTALAKRCRVNGWVDWNRDFDFADTGEQIFDDLTFTGDAENSLQCFSIPSGTSFNNVAYYARFRICAPANTCDQPGTTQNNVVNGEIEDYRWEWGTPTAVEVALFDAAFLNNQVLVRWETASELELVGFNLYRSTSESGPYARLNPTLIPAQRPGSPTGATYTWSDGQIRLGRVYYYKLEEVSANGESTFHGPVRVQTSARIRPGPRPISPPSLP